MPTPHLPAIIETGIFESIGNLIEAFVFLGLNHTSGELNRYGIEEDDPDTQNAVFRAAQILRLTDNPSRHVRLVWINSKGSNRKEWLLSEEAFRLVLSEFAVSHPEIARKLIRALSMMK